MPQLQKNIIFNQLFINWNEPIVLCEGILDAISINQNAIPLMGKFIQPFLLTKIIKTKPPKIYIALDNDAYSDGVKLAKELTNLSLQVYVTQFPKGEDPGSLSHDKV